jgi:serine phosphatase RsbU (regulator of sigma subunit)
VLRVRSGFVRPAAGARGTGRAWQLTLLVLPGLWVLGVVAFSLAFGARVQLAPLLAAAPAIACAGTGRRQCVVLGGACALFALVPLPGDPASLGERLGSACAILAVALASFLIAHRRLRMQRAYEEVRRIADVTQRVLLRPVPERVGPVAAAVEYLAAAHGARIGGDFYEVIETPFGVRAILGDVRGNGLDAVSGAVALLGAFREAGAVEPELTVVAARLDAALARHTAGTRGTEPVPPQCAEDFATAVLVEIPAAASSAAASLTESSSAESSPTECSSAGDATDATGGAGTARIVSCGHPAPYVVRGKSATEGAAEALEARAVSAATASSPALPLGLGALADEPYAACVDTIVLAPGDALVLYTDGVSDARSRSGAFFPLASALAGVGTLAPGAAARLVRERLLAHTRGALGDDAAVLVLRNADAV